MATTKKKTAAKSASGKAKSKTAPTDALALLRADHNAVIELFGKFEKSRRDDQKQKLADQICRELKIHATVEEEIFYPAIRQAQPEKDTDDVLNEADVEHDGAKKLIADIEAGQAGDELFDARVKVLSEYIKHHVKEEYSDIFPAARKAGIDLKAMGAQLAERKKQLKTAL